MKLEPPMSMELKILCGEWLTYCAISRYFEDMFEDEHMYSFSEFPRTLTIEQRFEQCPIYVAWHALFGDAYLFMLEMEILREETSKLFANCQYSEISDKIRANISKSNYSIFYAFVMIAGHHYSYFGESEWERIYIDEKCTPLFSKLRNEGFCEQKNKHFFWTSKIRPYLEHHNIWRRLNQPTQEEILVNSLTDEMKVKIAACAETKDLMSACLILEHLAGAEFGVAKRVLENHIYPEIWGKPQEPKSDVTFRWFAPNSPNH